MSGWTKISNVVVAMMPELGTAFNVYVVIAKHANADGVAWPSVPTIARMSGVASRTVRRALGTLQAKGLIRIERRKDESGRDAPSRYLLSPVRESVTGTLLGVRPCQGEGDKNDRGRVTPEHPEQEPIEQDTVNKRRGRAAKFVKPTLEEVRAYCRERKNLVDPQQFIDHYDSKGWMIGKSPMKDWRAAIRSTWERSNHITGNGQPKPAEPVRYRA